MHTGDALEEPTLRRRVPGSAKSTSGAALRQAYSWRVGHPAMGIPAQCGTSGKGSVRPGYHQRWTDPKGDLWRYGHRLGDRRYANLGDGRPGAEPVYRAMS